MSGNSRLTVATHALAWIALKDQLDGGPAVSEEIADSIQTNPVVVRRILGMAQIAGLVQSHRGTPSGWTLKRPADKITLAEIRHAVEQDELFALHRSTPSTECPIGYSVGPVLSDIYQKAEDAADAALGEVTLADTLQSSLEQSNRTKPELLQRFADSLSARRDQYPGEKRY